MPNVPKHPVHHGSLQRSGTRIKIGEAQHFHTVIVIVSVLSEPHEVSSVQRRLRALPLVVTCKAPGPGGFHGRLRCKVSAVDRIPLSGGWDPVLAQAEMRLVLIDLLATFFTARTLTA